MQDFYDYFKKEFLTQIIFVYFFFYEYDISYTVWYKKAIENKGLYGTPG